MASNGESVSRSLRRLIELRRNAVRCARSRLQMLNDLARNEERNSVVGIGGVRANQFGEIIQQSHAVDDATQALAQAESDLKPRII